MKNNEKNFIILGTKEEILTDYSTIWIIWKSNRLKDIINIVVFSNKNKNYQDFWYGFKTENKELCIITHNSIYNPKQPWCNLSNTKTILNKLSLKEKKMFIKTLLLFISFKWLENFISNLILGKVSYNDIVEIYNLLFKLWILREEAKIIKTIKFSEEDIKKIQKFNKIWLTEENIWLFSVYFNNILDIIFQLEIKGTTEIIAFFLDFMELNIKQLKKITSNDNVTFYKV